VGPFATKFALADQVGAGAMLISNEGNPGVPGRELPLWFDVTGRTTPSAALTIETGYDQMADAAAHVMVTLAQATTLPERGLPAPAAAARSLAQAAPHGLTRPTPPEGN
jgi:hypothetical protein